MIEYTIPEILNIANLVYSLNSHSPYLLNKLNKLRDELKKNVSIQRANLLLVEYLGHGIETRILTQTHLEDIPLLVNTYQGYEAELVKYRLRTGK